MQTETNTNPDAPLALVLGATGGIGGAVADRLVAHGWRVRALNRNPEAARQTRADLDWVKGDALSAADVLAAAAGARIVVHGVNPPAYRNWAGLQMPMLQATIAAARATGARIVFPGTVYNYGPAAFPLIAEDAPQQPVTRKGAIRVQMEAALRRAADEGVGVLIVRAGDFFGPKPGANNWMSAGLVKPGKPITAVTYPGPLPVAHCWGYLPDVAETMVSLAERDDLAPFEVFHMRGQTLTGQELVEALSTAAGRKLHVSRLPWLAIRAVSPFNETMREMLEMRYLWDVPVLLDNTRLVARLGAEPHTPIIPALRSALVGMDALPEAPARLAA